MHTFFRQRHPAVILTAVVLVAFLVVTLAWSGALTAAAQGIYNVVQRIIVGPYTEAVQIEKLQSDPGEPRPLPSGMWLVKTEIGNFGGDVPPGVEYTVRSVTDFEEAQELTPFYLRAPGYLLEGYTLREIKLVPGHAFLFYGDAGHDIILFQTQVGPQPSDDPNVGIAVKTGWVTDGSLEEVDLDGRKAAWVDGHSLTWEADGISYTVGGLDLSLEEAVRIAESLE